jgi:hypothetical protein
MNLRGAVLPSANGDAVGDEASKDLSKAIEGEPDARPSTLFTFCPPLRRDECEARGDRCFEDTKKDCG